MRERQNVLPRSYLHACLQLLLQEAPRHGYQLAAELEGLGIETRDKGLVYRALREIENDDLASSSWEPPAGGPVRRTYELTPKGRLRLDELTETLREAQRAFTVFVDRYDRLHPGRREAAA